MTAITHIIDSKAWPPRSNRGRPEEQGRSAMRYTSVIRWVEKKTAAPSL